jgi:hypothetical protein
MYRRFTVPALAAVGSLMLVRGGSIGAAESARLPSHPAGAPHAAAGESDALAAYGGVQALPASGRALTS